MKTKLSERSILPLDNSLDHLLEELALLQLRIKKELAIVRLTRDRNDRFDEFSGMFISEEEIDRYLSESEHSVSRDDINKSVAALSETSAVRRQELDSCIAKAIKGGRELRIPRLAGLFLLEPVEVEILVFCAAPDIEMKFERFYGYLQNDISKKRATIQLISKFMFGGPNRLLQSRFYLSVSSRLFEQELLQFTGGSAADDLPFTSRQVRIQESLLDYLLGIDRLDPDLDGVAVLIEPRRPEWTVDFYRRHFEISETIDVYARSRRQLPLFYIWGEKGSGKSQLIEVLALQMHKGVLQVDWRVLCVRGEDFIHLARLIRRDALLYNGIVHLRGFEHWPEGNLTESEHQLRILRLLEVLDGVPLVLTGRKRFEEVKQLGANIQRSFEIPLPTTDQRRDLWNSVLRFDAAENMRDKIDSLSVKFKFTPGQIRSALAAAAMSGTRGEGDETYVSISDLGQACRDESNHGLLAYAQKLEPTYCWDDIVLPEDKLNQLKEICNCIHEKPIVFGEWGFENKFSLGKGLNVLFAGPSGTGKTMSAEIIAWELGLDTYKLDLSRILSKYIGDTERALAKIFDEAETSNCILFFDEADALYGRRTELKDSHDRYANIEVNFLLQKIEEHNGIIILSSNLKRNMDLAFTRRLNYIVEFPFPDEVLRRKIWQKVFPDQTPLVENLNLEFLSKKFKLSGGNIKNIALNSAFLAAGNSGKVSMKHIILATKREYQKMGKICSKSEFSQYYDVVRDRDET